MTRLHDIVFKLCSYVGTSCALCAGLEGGDCTAVGYSYYTQSTVLTAMQDHACMDVEFYIVFGHVLN